MTARQSSIRVFLKVTKKIRRAYQTYFIYSKTPNLNLSFFINDTLRIEICENDFLRVFPYFFLEVIKPKSESIILLRSVHFKNNIYLKIQNEQLL